MGLLHRFFLECCPAHRDLHSFPTRRSSDLQSTGQPGREQVDHEGQPGAFVLAHGKDAARSEEHTSELQSRRDLVCRLLLEKKKKEKAVVVVFTGEAQLSHGSDASLPLSRST